jgi:hypothetical protein
MSRLFPQPLPDVEAIIAISPEKMDRRSTSCDRCPKMGLFWASFRPGLAAWIPWLSSPPWSYQKTFESHMIQLIPLIAAGILRSYHCFECGPPALRKSKRSGVPRMILMAGQPAVTSVASADGTHLPRFRHHIGASSLSFWQGVRPTFLFCQDGDLRCFHAEFFTTSATVAVTSATVAPM